jgi:hypothetical protein
MDVHYQQNYSFLHARLAHVSFQVFLGFFKSRDSFGELALSSSYSLSLSFPLSRVIATEETKQ